MKQPELDLIIKLASCASAKRFDELNKIFDDIRSENIDPLPVYEAVLQLYLFNGFPATIVSLKVFNKYYPDFGLPAERFNIELFSDRGNHNCRLVYDKNYDKLMDNFSVLSEDLKEWMIIEGYGKVMGRKGLEMKDRELINVAILCTNYYPGQLYSHIKGAFNTGSDYETVKSVINLTREFNSDENIQNSLEMLDKIMDSN